MEGPSVSMTGDVSSRTAGLPPVGCPAARFSGQAAPGWLPGSPVHGLGWAPVRLHGSPVGGTDGGAAQHSMAAVPGLPGPRSPAVSLGALSICLYKIQTVAVWIGKPTLHSRLSLSVTSQWGGWSPAWLAKLHKFCFGPITVRSDPQTRE